MQLIGVVPSDPSVLARLGELYDNEGDKSQAFQYYYDVRTVVIVCYFISIGICRTQAQCLDQCGVSDVCFCFCFNLHEKKKEEEYSPYLSYGGKKIHTIALIETRGCLSLVVLLFFFFLKNFFLFIFKQSYRYLASNIP
jgi:hypothetical protein